MIDDIIDYGEDITASAQVLQQGSIRNDERKEYNQGT